ncbi:MAG: 30S ribosomal protein S8e [Candidatus Woesearchaeota archaeon]
MITQAKSKRKASGGVLRSSFKKKITRKGGLSALTKLDKTVVKQKRARGGSIRLTLLSANKVNVFNPKTKKCEVAEMKNVTENPANRHFVRRDILTKGTIVDTSIGKVKITSRPGQEGTVNGILLE